MNPIFSLLRLLRPKERQLLIEAPKRSRRRRKRGFKSKGMYLTTPIWLEVARNIDKKARITRIQVNHT